MVNEKKGKLINNESSKNKIISSNYLFWIIMKISFGWGLKLIIKSKKIIATIGFGKFYIIKLFSIKYN